jgi:hypothetical protein
MAKTKGGKAASVILTAAGKARLKEMKNEPAPRKGWMNTPLEDVDEPKKGAKGRSTGEVSINVR